MIESLQIASVNSGGERMFEVRTEICIHRIHFANADLPVFKFFVVSG